MLWLKLAREEEKRWYAVERRKAAMTEAKTQFLCVCVYLLSQRLSTVLRLRFVFVLVSVVAVVATAAACVLCVCSSGSLVLCSWSQSDVCPVSASVACGDDEDG